MIPTRADILAIFRAQDRPLALAEVYRLASLMGYLGDSQVHVDRMVRPWEMEHRTRPLMRRMIAMAREGVLWRGGGDVWSLAPCVQGEIAGTR